MHTKFWLIASTIVHNKKVANFFFKKKNLTLGCVGSERDPKFLANNFENKGEKPLRAAYFALSPFFSTLHFSNLNVHVR
jgi:hypothetical protein